MAELVPARQHILDDGILNMNFCSWDVSVTVSLFSACDILFPGLLDKV